MSKKVVNNIIVGIFVLLSVSAFVWVMFKIDSGHGLFSKEYTLFARFSQVKGLFFGSEVSLMGLRVGTVKRVSIPDPKTKALIVEFSVTKDILDKIRQDSVATIKTSGVLGDKYLEISMGSPDSPPLKSGDMIQSDEPQDIFSKTGGLLDNIGKNFDKGSDLQSLIKNLNQVSQNLVVITGQLEKSKGLWKELTSGTSGTKINQSLAHLENIMKKIDNGDGTIGALINDPTIYEDVKAMMGGAKRSSILKYFMKSFIDSGNETNQKKK